MHVLLYDSLEVKVQQSWSENGEQVVVNGNGRVSIKLEEDEKSKAMLEGNYRNGLKDGLWRRTNKKGKSEIEQVFSNGKLLPGHIFKSSLIYVDVSHDRFKVGKEPYYLHKVERWMVDPTFYTWGYPIIASVMGWEVERVKTKSKPDYYKVHAQLNGKPHVYEEYPAISPEFPGGQKAYRSYLRNHVINPVKKSGLKIDELFYVNFTITEEGKVQDVTFPESFKSAAVKEIIEKGLYEMPLWKPATYNLVPIPTQYSSPISARMY